MARCLFQWICLAIVSCSGSQALSDATFSGAIFPLAPQLVDERTPLEIGASNILRPGDDPRATVRVDGESFFEASNIRLGTSPLAIPRLIVEGPNAAVRTTTLEGAGSISVTDGAWLGIGREGGGLLRLESLQGRLGQPSQLEIVGEGSLVSVGTQLLAGGTGSQIRVLDGGQLRVGSVQGSGVAEVFGGTHLEVNGDGSQLLYGGQLLLGGQSRPESFGTDIVVSNGGAVLPLLPNGRVVVGQSTTVWLDGGQFGTAPFGGQLLQVDGLIRGDGTVSGTMNVGFEGEVYVGPGQRLIHQGHVDLSGLVRIQGGELDIAGTLQGRETAQFVLEDAVLRLRDQALFDGNYIALSGRNDVFGEINPRRGLTSLTVASGASINLWNVAQFSEIAIEPGGSARFLRGMQGPRRISFGLADEAPIASLISVAQDAALYGTLELRAENSASYTAGDHYTLITADSIFAQFSDLELPNLSGGLALLPELTDTTLSVRVIDTAVEMPGDYNGDGLVNGADYTLLRDTATSDANFAFNHLVWTEFYGSRGGATPASVPEPSALVVGAIAVGLAAGFRRAA